MGTMRTAEDAKIHAHSDGGDAEANAVLASAKTSSDVVESTAVDVSSTAAINDRAVLARIDFRLVPVLTVLYMTAFLDRVNIGNANVFGLSTELGLSSAQYSLALCIFFIPYIIFEIPSNALLKRLRPNVFLSASMFLFGVTTLAQGFVTSYSGLLCTRFWLGFFETGVFPGCFYLLSMWYRRAEAQKRFTLFFLSTVLAGAFGGLLASAIGKLDGHRDKLAWRWIFIIEGSATAVIALAAYAWIPNFPEDVAWLSAAEKQWLTARLAEDVGDSGREKRPVRLGDLKMILTDYKFFTAALMYFGFLIPAYGFSYFAPTIIQGWHYSAVMTQLRTVPVWAAAWVFSLAMSVASDRLRHRFAFVLLGILVGVVGFVVLLTVRGRTNILYGGLFLALCGGFAPTPICVCWFTTNLAGHNRRAIGSAFQIAFGNFGGIISTFIFIPREAPGYKTGYGVCLASLVLAGLSATAMFVGLVTENRRRDRARKAGAVGDEDADGEDVGDLALGFRYMY